MFIQNAHPYTIAILAVILVGYGVYKLCKWMVKSFDHNIEGHFKKSKGL